MRSIKLPAEGLILLVRGYQLLISPWLGPVCRFTPTCSNYMIVSLRKYGLFKGGWRGTRRICRCHPFNRGGFDPP